MSKVIQIRGVPDDVHATLVDAAEAQGLSLTHYLRRELDHLARLADVHDHNFRVTSEVRRSMRTTVDRSEILAALDEGRSR